MFYIVYCNKRLGKYFISRIRFKSSTIRIFSRRHKRTFTYFSCLTRCRIRFPILVLKYFILENYKNRHGEVIIYHKVCIKQNVFYFSVHTLTYKSAIKFARGRIRCIDTMIISSKRKENRKNERKTRSKRVEVRNSILLYDIQSRCIIFNC